MKIKVTQEDIDAGEPCSAYACPIHRAIERIAKWPVGFIVGNSAVRTLIPLTGGCCRFDLPQEATAFIDLFDNPASRGLCHPFEFEIAL